VSGRQVGYDTGVTPKRAAGFGLFLGVAGILSYFLVSLHFGAWVPWARNTALPNWALIVAGLLLSAVGVRRARSVGGRWLAVPLAAVNVTLAALFAWFLYGMLAVPPVAGPAVGGPAPDFALTDQDGRAVHLADFRGKPLLLVFYRGHW
jgi:AhpC/TSA family